MAVADVISKLNQKYGTYLVYINRTGLLDLLEKAIVYFESTYSMEVTIAFEDGLSGETGVNYLRKFRITTPLTTDSAKALAEMSGSGLVRDLREASTLFSERKVA